MFITEMDAQGNCVRAEDPGSSCHRERRLSGSSDVSFSSMDEESYATAHNSLQRQSSSSAEGSGLGISGHDSRRTNAPRMGSNSTITAAAAAQGAGNWPGGIMRQVDVRVESRELEQLDAELRRRSRYLPREPRWTLAGDQEAISELTAFLRNVTPPPSNFMSLPSPTTTTLSSMSSLRRRKSATKKGALMKVVRLFRRGSKKKKNKKKVPSARPKSRSKKRPASPGLTRWNAVKRKRPPRIKLPDTAVAGRTVDGHRHIAISIPIEHAHLGPEFRYGYPSPMGRTRSRSMSSADTPSPRVYNDINYSVRPLTAFVAEPHIGTQLGPLVEERESLSSRSWEKGSSNSSGQGEAVIARKVRLASRNTFGTVHEELSRPTTSSGMPPQASPPRTSDESGGPRTPRTSEEMRARAYRQTLAALAGVGGGPPIRPAAVGHGPQRPVSAHSFRSFAASSPGRVYFPMRKSSLHPSGGAVETRRPRTMSNTTGGTNNSRDSSRDQTLQESIFSERSYLESLDTVSTGNLKEEFHHSPVLVSEATFARRFEGSDVVECEPRSSVDSQRRKSRENRQSGSSQFSASSREKRTSWGSRASASEKGKQRASYEGPVIVRPDHRHSGGSIDKSKQREIVDGPIIVRPEKRHSGGSTASAKVIFGKRKGELAPVVVTGESPPVVAQETQQKTGEMEDQERPTTPVTGRRSKFVEDLAEAPLPEVKGEDHQVQEIGDKQQTRTDSENHGKEKGMGDQEGGNPSIEVQQATPTEANIGQKLKNGPSRRSRTHKENMDEPEPQPPVVSTLAVPPERSRSREKRKDKGKHKEENPVLPSEEIKRPSTPEGQSTEAKNSSPIPSPKERRDRRKSILLSRKERVAELRAALEKPGSQPSDLLWERRLSTSSISSNGSTPRTARMNRKRDSFPYAPAALSPSVPRTAPKELSFTRVLTVADVQPSSPPGFELVRKGSIALSVSSPATVATFVKTSPVPPYRSIGSVTPPESPTDSFPVPSPSSQFSTVDVQGTPLRFPPSSPVKGRITRRRSGRTSPTSPGGGRRSPVAHPENSPPRPKTAGKGALASKKPFFEGRAATPPSDAADRDDHMAGLSTGQAKSILKMSRSEIFDRYEALREKQTRDMERRIRRLERNGDYWLTSMLPILSDMSQTLKIAVAGHEQQQAGRSKGKEAADRDRTPTRYDDGRQSRLADRSMNAESVSRGKRPHGGEDVRVRSDDSFDRGESFVRHSAHPTYGGRGDPHHRGRQRLYLHDDATLGPARGYSLDRPSSTSGSRSFSMDNIHRSNPPSRMAAAASSSLAADSQSQHQQQQQQHSGSTTMVDSTTARAHSFARPTSKCASTSTNLREDIVAEADRLARLERMGEKIDAEIRRFPLVPSTSPLSSRRKSFASRDRDVSGRGRLLLAEDSEESLRTYQGTEETDRSPMEEEEEVEHYWSRQRGGGDYPHPPQHQQHQRRRGRREDSFDTIEPLMRELQLAGSRVSMESPRSEDLGDNEVRTMRQGPPGPRAVVGFGAFSM